MQSEESTIHLGTRCYENLGLWVKGHNPRAKGRAQVPEHSGFILGTLEGLVAAVLAVQQDGALTGTGGSEGEIGAAWDCHDGQGHTWVPKMCRHC